MRKVLVSAAATVAVLSAAPAGAVTLVSSSAVGPSTLTFYTLTGAEDLTNNAAPFANGGPLLRGPFDAYLFDEGTNDGVQSLLLHYDRAGGVVSVGRAAGAFVLQLAANEIFLGAVDKAPGLLATDPSNGVLYQSSLTGAANIAATIARGTEAPDAYSFSFNSGLNQLTVTYNFTTDGIAQDQVRFGFATVPEPATWALMIGGFGLAGASLRRRRTAAA